MATRALFNFRSTRDDGDCGVLKRRRGITLSKNRRSERAGGEDGRELHFCGM